MDDFKLDYFFLANNFSFCFATMSCAQLFMYVLLFRPLRREDAFLSESVQKLSTSEAENHSGTPSNAEYFQHAC